MQTKTLVLKLIFLGCSLSQAIAAPIEDQLFGVKLGSDPAALERVHKGLYVHRLRLGEVLHEACNQKSLEVFTFSEEAWSPARITDISVRLESDVSVCRDSTGQLPDLAIEPRTPRGLALGDSRDAVIQKYGKPSEERPGMLVYRDVQVPPDAQVTNLQLFIEVRADKVVGISLSGDIPGVKKP